MLYKYIINVHNLQINYFKDVYYKGLSELYVFFMGIININFYAILWHVLCDLQVLDL